MEKSKSPRCDPLPCCRAASLPQNKSVSTQRWHRSRFHTCRGNRIQPSNCREDLGRLDFAGKRARRVFQQENIGRNQSPAGQSYPQVWAPGKMGWRKRRPAKATWEAELKGINMQIKGGHFQEGICLGMGLGAGKPSWEGFVPLHSSVVIAVVTGQSFFSPFLSPVTEPCACPHQGQGGHLLVAPCPQEPGEGRVGTAGRTLTSPHRPFWPRLCSGRAIPCSQTRSWSWKGRYFGGISLGEGNELLEMVAQPTETQLYRSSPASSLPVRVPYKP